MSWTERGNASECCVFVVVGAGVQLFIDVLLNVEILFSTGSPLLIWMMQVTLMQDWP